MYSTCEPATKNKERIQKCQETADSRYIYQKELDHASFHHDMAYENFKDSARRTASDKELSDKAFNNASNPKYDGYQRLILQFFTNVLMTSLLTILLEVKMCQTNN